PLQITRAVLNGTAELPCDVTPPTPNDSYILVVWYKQDVNPIYSYDIRGKHANKASIWASDNLDQRATFKPSSRAKLEIKQVKQSDEGEYRCRVDFGKNPTRNSRIQLNIIIPPEKPNIINEKRIPIESTAGPYDEGGSMKLTCLVSGGQPEPTVRWWRGESMLEAKDGPGDRARTRKSVLVVEKLDRSDLHAEFTCQASNNNISLPVSTSVFIDMNHCVRAKSMFYAVLAYETDRILTKYLVLSLESPLLPPDSALLCRNNVSNLPDTSLANDQEQSNY
ncbi:hypothetical protein QAD02_004783, partial [Eretmocerus hayati]